MEWAYKWQRGLRNRVRTGTKARIILTLKCLPHLDNMPGTIITTMAFSNSMSLKLPCFRIRQNSSAYLHPPTNTIKANYNQFSYNVSINPKSIAANLHNLGLKTLLNRFYLQSSLQTGQKQMARQHPLYNPFHFSARDTF